MTGDMGTGNIAGFNAFCDWLIQKGLMGGSAVEPLRSATKQIVSVVEPDTPDLDLRALDADDFMNRFDTLAGQKYSPDSLRAYRNRFNRGLELYRQYLEVGAANFRPPAGRAPARRRSEPGGNGRSAAKPKSADAGVAPPPSTPNLIDYPFPLRSGVMAHLYLPSRLDKDDADRMSAYLRALVYEPQRQIEPGGDLA
jgi:hypothetical protein